jgi:hypothetical protein
MDILKTAIVSLVICVLAFTGYAVATKPNSDAPEKLGALSSPDLPYPYFSFGGVRSWAGRTDSLTAATTTVCAIQSPAATSTLRFGSIRFGVSSTSATTVYIAKATTPYATTTALGQCALAANAQGTCLASTTPTVNVDPAQVFAPNTYLVVGMTGGVGTFSPTGTCEATWIEN